MPEGVEAIQQRCIALIGRPSPTVSPHASDDEAEDFETRPPLVEGEVSIVLNAAAEEELEPMMGDSIFLSELSDPI